MYKDLKPTLATSPAVLWKLLSGNWYMAAIFNAGMLFLSVVFLKNIGDHIGISIDNKLLFFLVLLLETFIYTVDVLKEIPTLFLFTALSFYFLKNRWLPFFFITSRLNRIPQSSSIPNPADSDATKIVSRA